jgi:hypothetical protein
MDNHRHKGADRIMNNKPPVGKTLTWAYAAVTAVTAISILVPILMEKIARKEKR